MHSQFRRLIHQLSHSNDELFRISAEVRTALQRGKGVVALESTVITHGLPHPRNLEVALRLEEVVRSEGAVPATIALLDGQVRVGLSPAELERIAHPDCGARKVSTRDVANCLANLAVGSTTVAATMWIAHRAGIRVFATGGIGGVHREGELTLDISADLTELGRTPVVVVCAGAKSILDIGRTLEYMETQCVNVVVFDEAPFFPGFFSPRTPFKAPHCTHSLEQIADILIHSARLGLPNGTLVACPLPAELGAHGEAIERAVQTALEEAKQKGIAGKEVTPFLLQRVNQLTGSASQRTNILLLENNARIGAQLANRVAVKTERREHGGKAESGRTRWTATAKGNETAEANGHEKRPKIVCAGAAIVDFEVLVDRSAVDRVGAKCSGAYLPARIVQRPGGVGRNHADALTRLGCQVSLLSALGTNGTGKDELDPFARFLLDKCTHMDWSHCFLSAVASTASSMGISANGAIERGFISADPIMAQMDERYIDAKAELIADADFVLIDANLNVPVLRRIQQLAERHQTKVWFEPTNTLKVPKLFGAFGPDAMHKLACISPNLAELEHLAVQLGGKSTHFVAELKAQICSESFCKESLSEWLSKCPIPLALFPPSLDHLVVTCDARGVVVFSKNGHQIALNVAAPPRIRPEHIVSVSGSGDCFNAGFLASILRGLSMEHALREATACAKMSLRSADAVPLQIGEQTEQQQAIA